MFKSLFRLMHGQLHVGAGRVDDRSAMALIDHQARVAARDLAVARRELVAAIASEKSSMCPSPLFASNSARIRSCSEFIVEQNASTLLVGFDTWMTTTTTPATTAMTAIAAATNFTTPIVASTTPRPRRARRGTLAIGSAAAGALTEGIVEGGSGGGGDDE